MATPTHLRGHHLQVKLGDGATPTEAFTFFCIPTSKSLTRNQETEDHFEVDCANPNNPPVRIVTPKSQSWTFSMEGRVDAAKILVLRTWLDLLPHNIKLEIAGGLSGAQGGGVWTGAVVLETLTEGTVDHGVVTFAANFKGTSALPTWVAAV